MKPKPVQWMYILVLVLLFGGYASTTTTSNENQQAVQESYQRLLDKQEISEVLYQYTYNFDGKSSLVVQISHGFYLQTVTR